MLKYVYVPFCWKDLSGFINYIWCVASKLRVDYNPACLSFFSWAIIFLLGFSFWLFLILPLMLPLLFIIPLPTPYNVSYYAFPNYILFCSLPISLIPINYFCFLYLFPPLFFFGYSPGIGRAFKVAAKPFYWIF